MQENEEEGFTVPKQWLCSRISAGGGKDWTAATCTENTLLPFSSPLLWLTNPSGLLSTYWWVIGSTSLRGNFLSLKTNPVISPLPCGNIRRSPQAAFSSWRRFLPQVAVCSQGPSPNMSFIWSLPSTQQDLTIHVHMKRTNGVQWMNANHSLKILVRFHNLILW